MTENLKEMLREVLKEELTGIRSDVVNVQLEVGGLKKEVTEMGSNVGNLQKEVTGLCTSMKIFKEELTEVKTHVAELHFGQERIERKIGSIPSQFEQLKNSIDEDIKRLTRIQERQQLVIETLSARSIQQQTDIKELNYTKK
ncbi:hypothetical protein BABA_06771 [Neobacillus bataviensis LMG 21833]|uniref:Uncharacterized protein n=1 Tax=Neobacillus bataviensis LMG 21833 TaxID=1117379 RepID=K6DP21_9BACI|nr:hypothetical protein [Neobacillus bataviensis]EKN70059.1 hypothetical protein BABA_06771 [Neobacillus bataviensis LMG 21833]